MNHLWMAAAIGFGLGFVAIWSTLLIVRHRTKAHAQKEAQELIEEAEENAKLLVSEAEAEFRQFAEELENEFEEEKLSKQSRLDQLNHSYEDKKKRLKGAFRVKEEYNKGQLSRFQSYESQVSKRKEQYEKLRNNNSSLVELYVKKLLELSPESRESIIETICTKLENEAKVRETKRAQLAEEEAQVNAERDAKRVLGTALNRFARAYCPERGISYISLDDERARQRVIGNEMEIPLLLEKEIGVDIAFDERSQSLSVTGFDPVRRELGRWTLERIKKDKKAGIESVSRILAKTKKDLFAKIRKDGLAIAKELKVKNLHPDIINMMGSLRYRYSFTQNQYFHCAEVGFLCGLLASELGEDIFDSRRAGMLHDIGKAMDHSVEGGHAVIGADFIEKNEEKDHIVHAVRAHHFDETPSSNLAYLVIAADAMSGARPGARRSTAASYTQKMNDLEVIAKSFEGVVDTQILSAGREVRVAVNSHKMDEMKCVELSKSIARKIENDMSFPGQIKVTVVRETTASDLAK